VSLNSYLGQETIITLELGDGTTFRGKAYATSVGIRQELHDYTSLGDAQCQYIRGPVSWDIQFSGLGALEMTAEQVRQQRQASEWRCEWCGAVMPSERRSCEACGAWRSFLLAGDEALKSAASVLECHCGYCSAVVQRVSQCPGCGSHRTACEGDEP